MKNEEKENIGWFYKAMRFIIGGFWVSLAGLLALLGLWHVMFMLCFFVPIACIVLLHKAVFSDTEKERREYMLYACICVAFSLFAWAIVYYQSTLGYKSAGNALSFWPAMFKIFT